MGSLAALPATLWRMALAYWRTLWVRVAMMGVLALASIGLTQLVEPLVPEEIGRYVGGTAADRLLDIIANAMLAVTIFSITVMVSVYRSTASQWTPRVHRLIMADPTTQNTLSVFIGAYVYALTAIILREIGVFIDDRALVLFVLTVGVLMLIVYHIIRWTLHLQTFGSLVDTTRQLEDMTLQKFAERLERPCLGANAFTDEVELPEEAWAVRSVKSAYVTHIFQESLNSRAEQRGLDIYIVASPGKYLQEGDVMAWVAESADTSPDEEIEDERETEDMIRDHIVLDDLRTYEQDPRFGLIVMGEIGSKALSPGINDPGTAIDVITRIARILSHYDDEELRIESPRHPRLWVRPLDPADLIEDGFGSIARDGRGVIEVQQRLQKILEGLMRHPDAGLARAAKNAAVIEYLRAREGLTFGHDLLRLERSTTDEVLEAAVEAGRDWPRPVT